MAESWEVRYLNIGGAKDLKYMYDGGTLAIPEGWEPFGALMGGMGSAACVALRRRVKTA